MKKSKKEPTVPKVAPEWFERWRKAVNDYTQAEPKRSLNQLSMRAVGRPAYLSETFNEVNIPGVDNFLAVCEAAGINPGDILKPLAPEEEAWLNLIRSVRPDRRRWLIEFVQKWAHG